MDMSARPADTSIQKIEIEVNGQKMWMDFDEFQRQRTWMEELERDYWAQVNPLFRKYDREKTS